MNTRSANDSATGSSAQGELLAALNAAAMQFEAELIEIRRDIHRHPELARTEARTTGLIFDRLVAAGLQPQNFVGTGLFCDIGHVTDGERRVALRADLDALPLQETSGVPFSSSIADIAHACGHDVHSTIVLGAGLVLAELDKAGKLPHPVRLIFQPAEEVMPGGALDVLEQGVLEGVGSVFALHCDPRFDVGTVGTRLGPITSASDQVTITLHSRGGHTSRPHLTGDLVYALGEIVTQVPAILGRRLDPRSGVNLTWGMVEAGVAHNAIPNTGVIKGTLRCLDVRAWERAAHILHDAVGQVAAPFDVEVEVHHERGVPPVVNDDAATARLESAARDVVGEDNVLLTEQSLGGEDFAWFLHRVPGSMARLGTRTPGGRTYDIHQGDLVIDESAISIGVRLLAGVATR